MAPVQPPPPPGLMEYLSMLAQNGSLPGLVVQNQVLPVSTPVPSLSTPPTNTRSFTRAGRGQGGALAQKQEVSKQITAPATKRKSLIDPDLELQSSSTLDPAGKGSSRKRAKTTKNPVRRRVKLPPVEPSQAVPDSPTLSDPFPSPISTPTPARPVRPAPRATKPRVTIPLPPSPIPDIPSGDDNDITDVQGTGAYDESYSPEPETPTSLGGRGTLAPPPLLSPMTPLTGSPLDLLQEFLAQHHPPASPAIHSPTTVLPSQSPQVKASRGIKNYPDGWRKILNSAKDLVRSSILLDEPFPGPHQARVAATESLHEAYTTECDSGTVAEPGFSWGDGMLSILLNEISTCRSELKKLAQILVGSDPDLFPSPKNIDEPFKDLTAPEIRVVAAKSLKKPTRSNMSHDPIHVRTLVTDRLTDFAFLNDPPTVTGDLLANSILERLCQSFYEEDKWQRSLMINIGGDDEWTTTVTFTMVAFAATSYYNALEEWRSGNFIRKPFESEKFAKIYTDIHNYVTGLLETNPQADAIADRFQAWAEESGLVQELADEAGGNE